MTAHALDEARDRARHYARELRHGGHRAHTARLFTPKRAGALVLLDAGRIAIWTDRRKIEESGTVPLVHCVYCAGTHVRDTAGRYDCTSARFVTQIVATMPSLRRAPHCMPWSATKFAAWARTSPAITHGSIHAAAFVLAVWSGDAKRWKGSLVFDVVRAFQSWDEPHRAAFRAWAAAPWWP